MFAIGIRYLNDWAMAAADGARKEVAEWPPHPDRIFMALAAAWFETDEDPAEEEALRWLESLDPPAIFASECATRSSYISYVPVNDTSVSRRAPSKQGLKALQDAGLAALPEHRSRQPRGFPVAIPHDSSMFMIWQSKQLDTHREGLESLASKVTHVGHSASLVQVWVANDDKTPEPTWIPSEGVASHRMRVFSSGRLDALTQMYNKADVLEYADLKAQADSLRGARKKRVNDTISERFGSRVPVSLRPTPTRWQGYDKPKPAEDAGGHNSVFDPNLVVFAIRGKRVPITTTLRLTQALRNSLMDSCSEQPPPEWFSGHTPDGKPSTKPHMALLPLPFVDSHYADGRVMGLALALPRGLNQQDAARCLSGFLYDSDTGLPRKHTLFDGRWFECEIELETRERPPVSLISDMWTRKSRVWASATPVVLNRHFDGNDMWEKAAESMMDACEHIGLPRPSELLLHPTSLVQAAPLSREFPRMSRRGGNGQRRHVHTVIIFDEPVQGPVMIGAGRYRGYGLCRPMDSRGDGNE